jgi:UDP-N-acetylmuramoyl-tripeptide--D-alanyl-D-alanine ligase
MMRLSLAEVAAVTGGMLVGLSPDRFATGKVEFDSRRVEPGDLFLAVVGEHADGHDFADAARTAGAVATIATRPLPGGAVVVDDPIAAITALARHEHRRLTATTIALTGSSGKTSTKDLLAQVLAPHGATVAPPGSYNNELGHPYTVLLADEHTRFLVLECSARGIGHIGHLAEIAPPRIGAVLNVGSAHLGEFGSVAAIAQAKGELIEALPSAADGGVAVLNADDPVVLAMAGRTTAQVVTVGEHRNADIRAEGVTLGADGCPSFVLHLGGALLPVRLRLVGQHQVGNALSAAAMALAAGLTPVQVAAGLSSATPRSRWRMAVTQTAGGVTVINDAYNANPESMRAALKALAAMSAGRRSVAVLGAMAELGPASPAEHDALGRFAVRLDVHRVFAVGDGARPISHAAGLESSRDGESEWLPDVEAAVQRLSGFLLPGDVLLVKGSRAAGMERVAAGVIDALGGPAVLDPPADLAASAAHRDPPAGAQRQDGP